MAQAEGSLDAEDLSCSICLDVLKNPVTTPCGHNYCEGCIKGYWDKNDHTGVYSCPQCRETFSPRPVLGKNTMLAEVVEKLKKTGLQAAPPAEQYIKPDDVICDICTERKKIAVKSCRVCRASYCQTHLQPHFKCPDLRRHKLIKATADLPETTSPPQEQLVLLHCCCADQLCFNALCVMKEHRGTATARRTKKQRSVQAAVGYSRNEAPQILVCWTQNRITDNQGTGPQKRNDPSLKDFLKIFLLMFVITFISRIFSEEKSTPQ